MFVVVSRNMLSISTKFLEGTVEEVVRQFFSERSTEDILRVRDFMFGNLTVGVRIDVTNGKVMLAPNEFEKEFDTKVSFTRAMSTAASNAKSDS